MIGNGDRPCEAARSRVPESAGGACACSPRCVRIFSITGRSRIAAMIPSSPAPQAGSAACTHWRTGTCGKPRFGQEGVYERLDDQASAQNSADRWFAGDVDRAAGA